MSAIAPEAIKGYVPNFPHLFRPLRVVCEAGAKDHKEGVAYTRANGAISILSILIQEGFFPKIVLSQLGRDVKEIEEGLAGVNDQSEARGQIIFDLRYVQRYAGTLK